MTKNDLVNNLKCQIGTVIFTKADGTERTLRCTLEPLLIESFVGKVEGKGTGRKISDEVLPVWDLDSNQWRSFRLDSVKSVSFEPLLEAS